MSTSSNSAMLEFVALANDQTDGLVGMMNTFSGGLATPTPRDWDLIINHMQLLQRSLAKSIDQEISLLEAIDKHLKKFEES